MLLTVHVKTRAKQNAITKWLDPNTIKMEVIAAPEKGKANQAIIKTLSKELNIPQNQITIKRGFTTSIKHIEIKKTG